MDEAFINKVRATLTEHLEDDSFGVAELSAKIGLSKSQTLRRIKRATGKTASEFIRDTRLNEAARLLKNDNFTASEIAYRVGFGSPSYFNKCFHDHFGLTPGEYKLRGIEMEKKPGGIETGVKRNYGKATLIAMSLFLFFTILFLNRSYFQNEVAESTQEMPSIAVLPFLNLAEVDESEYLADGITEAITLELSKNKMMRVISRSSAMTFKNSNKSLGAIAEELDVNLLLEGSVLFVNDSLRVVAQLIEPFPKEKHLWAKNYDFKFQGILSVVKSISADIGREINLSVLPENVKTENYPVDPLAYDLYLRGRHLLNHETPESVNSGIDYLKRSIVVDSNFAPPYASLAESYVLMNKFLQNDEEKQRNIDLGKVAVDKAIQKGPYLAEAYITKGNILGKFDWNWQEMYSMTIKGLELDPNNAYAHTQLSKYYLYTNQMDLSIEEAQIAEKLDPLNARAARIVAEQYFYDRQYEKSLQQYNKVLELHPDDPLTYNGIAVLYWVMGDLESAKESALKFQQLMKNHSMVEKLRSSTFDDAFYFWLDRAKKKEPLYCSNPSWVAMVSQFMGQEEEALKYLEVAYVKRDIDLPPMLLRPMFESLYDEPRFLDLVAKTDVNINIGLTQ